MDLLAGYGSGEDGPTSAQNGAGASSGVAPPAIPQRKVVTPKVVAAPSVMIAASAVKPVADPLKSGAGPTGARSKATQQGIVLYNPKADVMLAPMQGPANPFRPEMAVPAGGRAVKTGVIEPSAMEDWSFHEQYHTFDRFGYAMDAQGRMVGSSEKFAEREGATILTAGEGDVRRQRKRKARDGAAAAISAGDAAASGASSSGAGAAAAAAAAKAEMDLGDETTHGVWAPEEARAPTDVEAGTMSEAQKKYREEMLAEKAKKKKEFDQDEFEDRRDERKMGHLLPPRHNRDTSAPVAASQFHGGGSAAAKAKDYQGRAWSDPPAGVREGDATHQAFPPKRCIHRFTGHSKGVQKVEFFPGYGHLLLSGGMDGKVKIWDVYNDRAARRTYSGHSAAVRDVKFSNDGKRFMSAGYDRFIRLWDTETGQVIQTLTNRKMPYCARFYPVDNDIVIAGCSDNKVVQWDIKTGEVTQEYNHHLAPVNTVLFVEDDQKIVTTSDDKKVLIWEYNIPVPIKYIAEPHMHSMPATALHPSGAYWVGQSLDNQILTWGARDRFRQNRKKEFKGHIVAGYACQMAFSPNGKFLCSGDGQGKMFVWDWGSTKVYKKLDAHEGGPAICVAWHPVEASWVASCGWDGVIKLWD